MYRVNEKRCQEKNAREKLRMTKVMRRLAHEFLYRNASRILEYIFASHPSSSGRAEALVVVILTRLLGTGTLAGRANPAVANAHL
jgi:hypothetical protein